MIDSVGARQVLQAIEPLQEAREYLEVKSSFRNGVPFTVSRDEPVLVADLTVTLAGLALVPTRDLDVKTSWALNYSYRFVANSPIFPFGQVKMGDGRRFLVFRDKGRSGLFVNEDNQICSKAIALNPEAPVWLMGTLSQEPEAGLLERRMTERPQASGGYRIVFNGLQAGVMSFQETTVDGATVRTSVVRSFDQFAKQITIGVFTFDVLAAADGKVTLKAEIPSRVELGPGEASKLKLRQVR